VNDDQVKLRERGDRARGLEKERNRLQTSDWERLFEEIAYRPVRLSQPVVKIGFLPRLTCKSKVHHTRYGTSRDLLLRL